MKLHVYFSFNGNCGEALEFYKKALSGNITESHPYSENPEACANMPADWHSKIMHATFIAGDIMFMASDVMPGGSCPSSQTVVYETSPITLSLNFDTEAKQAEIFYNLATDGVITMALQDTFWGAKFGMLTDKFGIKWMFNCDKVKA